MNDYIQLNKDRWNKVNNDYTQPLTHEELEEARNNPIAVALTVGKKVPKEWFEKASGRKLLGLAWVADSRVPFLLQKVMT